MDITLQYALVGIQERMYRERNVKVAAIEQSYKGRQDGISTEAKQLEKLEQSARIGNGAAKLAVNSVEKIRNELIKMSRALQNLESGGDPKVNATNFDLAVKQINSLAKRAQKGSDLMGNRGPGDFQPRTVSYRGSNGAEIQMQGVYVGSDFTITDQATGNVWVSDLQTGKVVEYSDLANKVKTGREAILNSEAVMQSQTGNEVTFTYKPDSDNVAITGDIQFGGLGVGSSFNYDLTTTEGREAAKDAVIGALRKLRTAETIYKGHESTVDIELKRIRSKMQEYSDQSAELSLEQNEEVRVLDVKTRQKYAAIEKSFAYQSASSAGIQAYLSQQISADNPFKRMGQSSIVTKAAEKMFGGAGNLNILA